MILRRYLDGSRVGSSLSVPYVSELSGDKCNDAASLHRRPNYIYRPTGSKISKIFDMSHFGVIVTRWPVAPLQ
jgi:hypothetical protein